jgi:hypothetical protein
LLQVFKSLVQQALQLGRHHHFHAPPPRLMLAQRFRTNFIRPFAAAGLNQLAHIVFEISGQHNIHGATLIRREFLSTGNLPRRSARALIRSGSRQSPEYELCQLSERKPGVLAELAAERARLLEKESAELEKQADKLAAEIKELAVGAASRIG